MPRLLMQVVIVIYVPRTEYACCCAKIDNAGFYGDSCAKNGVGWLSLHGYGRNMHGTSGEDGLYLGKQVGEYIIF